MEQKENRKQKPSVTEWIVAISALLTSIATIIDVLIQH